MQASLRPCPWLAHRFFGLCCQPPFELPQERRGMGLIADSERGVAHHGQVGSGTIHRVLHQGHMGQPWSTTWTPSCRAHLHPGVPYHRPSPISPVPPSPSFPTQDMQCCMIVVRRLCSGVDITYRFLAGHGSCGLVSGGIHFHNFAHFFLASTITNQAPHTNHEDKGSLTVTPSVAMRNGPLDCTHSYSVCMHSSDRFKQ